MASYVDARRAAEHLGVTRATLYAYVSRGLLRSRAIPQSKRREYHLEDLEQLVRQRDARRDPRRSAHRALSVSGLPVLTSELTWIDSGVLYYRGVPALKLARSSTLEEVAELLWGAPFAEETDSVPTAAQRRVFTSQRLIPSCQTYLAWAEQQNLAAYHLEPDAVRRTGARIIRGLAAVAAQDWASNEPVAARLCSAWKLSSRTRQARIQAALILCADHELNASAFTARCIASAGATPYMAVSGALGALSGFRHGGHIERVAALFDETGTPQQVIVRRLQQGLSVPGVGHPLYPDGDPRGRELLALAARSPARSRALGFARAATELLGQEPTLDFGLLSLTRSLGLVDSTALALFASGRSVGWIAHCIEQYQSPELIRPRARYAGPKPGPRPNSTPPRP